VLSFHEESSAINRLIARTEIFLEVFVHSPISHLTPLQL
jgi:hypothetical protein